MAFTDYRGTHHQETSSDSQGSEMSNSDNPKPKIVGIYGISGCGKSHLIDRLKVTLNPEDFTFYEGSDQIVSIIGESDGLERFKKMDKESQTFYREQHHQYRETKRRRREGFSCCRTCYVLVCR